MGMELEVEYRIGTAPIISNMGCTWLDVKWKHVSIHFCLDGEVKNKCVLFFFLSTQSKSTCEEVAIYNVSLQ